MEDKQENTENKQEIKHLVRIANTDLNGSKQLYHALTKIKGISFVFANMVCNLANVDKTKKVGLLSEQEISRLNEVIKAPGKFNAPSWILNRRKDYEINEDKHLFGPDLRFTKENDIKRLKKIKSYKGVRHSEGLPVRGQRTKSNFRKNKGKGSLGVKRKKIRSGKV